MVMSKHLPWVHVIQFTPSEEYYPATHDYPCIPQRIIVNIKRIQASDDEVKDFEWLRTIGKIYILFL